MEMAGTLTLARKPLPSASASSKLDGKVDLSWNISRLVVMALKSPIEVPLRRHQTLIENKLAGSNRSTLTHDKDASGGDGLLAIETDDIDIDTGGEKRLADDRPGPLMTSNDV